MKMMLFRSPPHDQSKRVRPSLDVGIFYKVTPQDHPLPRPADIAVHVLSIKR
jgi:hypothetical protein